MLKQNIYVYFRYYSSLDLLKLAYYFLTTKLIMSNARLIRGPIDLRGKKNILIGKGFSCGRNCRIETNPSITKYTLVIGDMVELNDAVHITAFNDVRIGNNVLMASRIYISDTSHGSYAGNDKDIHPSVPPSLRPFSFKTVIIEDNVWLGEGVSILPGAHIGKGAIIGANSVVIGNIPEYSIAVGAPAKVTKRFNFIINKWEST
jgi:acetyltransferase-like isoleucine patch superfamily enzyme